MSTILAGVILLLVPVMIFLGRMAADRRRRDLSEIQLLLIERTRLLEDLKRRPASAASQPNALRAGAAQIVDALAEWRGEQWGYALPETRRQGVDPYRVLVHHHFVRGALVSTGKVLAQPEKAYQISQESGESYWWHLASPGESEALPETLVRRLKGGSP